METNSDKVQQIAVVVRGAGERTEQLCLHLVSQQVPPEQIVVIHETPFSQAVRRGFEIGIEQGRDWTLCLDADVLLKHGAIKSLVGLAEQQPDNTFMVQGKILDKLLGSLRAAGNHLYRTSLLRQALDETLITNEVIRPEQNVISQMTERGFPSSEQNLVIGLHDYEQYFRDIFRKAAVHARKFEAQVQYAAGMWRRLAADDPDYRVALWGLSAGQNFEGRMTIDVRAFPQEIDGLLDMIQLSEKMPLAVEDFSPATVDQILERYVVPPEHAAWEAYRASLRGDRRSRAEKAQAKRSQLGVVRFSLWLAGKFLQKSGLRLQSLADGNQPEGKS